MRTTEPVREAVDRTWKHDLAAALVESGIEVAAHVPDARLGTIVSELSRLGVGVHTLTREEECVGYAAGYALAGGRPVVLMQCSGLGNALNALGSLVVPYTIGMPLIISMRGTLGIENPSQVLVGRATGGFLDALGIQWFSARNPADVVELTKGIVEFTSSTSLPAGLVLEQTLQG